ncbi:MAG: hypothetical protein LBK98_09115, partial [Peptococcaceae bacterium]|nr:hypothetical protein [Peptococcaceae bacterium]
MSEAGGDLPVYLVGFPQDTPILGLLPADFGAAACFDDCPAAADFFREREVAGPTPTILVNCLPFYRRVDLLKSDSDGVLLEQLSALREAVGDGGVKLLLPEEKNGDQNLLIDLMSQGFYDFWFLTALSTALLREILSESRDFRALEAYLSTLPLPQIRAAAAGKGWAGKLGLARWQKPEWLADLPAKTKKYVFRRLLSRGPAVPGIEGEAETDFPIWPEGELDEVMSGEPGWETGEGMAGEPGWETGEVMSWALGRETGEVMSGAPGRERGEGMSGATDGGPRPASAASTGAGAGWPSRLAAPAREAAAARGETGPTGGATEKRRPLTAPFLAGRTRRRFGGGPDPCETQDLSGGTVAFFSAEDSLLPY